VAATLKFIDYNVAMTFILNNNNNNKINEKNNNNRRIIHCVQKKTATFVFEHNSLKK